jgi:hypothetical protein
MRIWTHRLGAAAAAAAAFVLASTVHAETSGQQCEYAITADPPLAPASGGPGSFLVSTGAACAWTVSAFTRAVDPATFAASQTPAVWVHLTVVSGIGPASVGYTVDRNAASATRSAYIGFTDTATSGPAFDVFGFEAKVILAQTGAAPASVAPWGVGDVIAGLGSAFSDRGTYRAFTPSGQGAVVNGPDLHDAFASTPVGEFGGVTTGCVVDPAGTHDLWTTSWDGLRIGRFNGATHQLTATLDLSPASLASVQRRTGTVPVPQTSSNVDGFVQADISYSEQIALGPNGEFYVGTSSYAAADHGLGYAYLLKFARNDDGAIPGCGAAGPCLLDWWRVDAGAELPAGQSPQGAHAAWTKAWKAGYSSLPAGTHVERLAAAEAAVAALVSTVSYHPNAASGQAWPSTAGVDGIDLSSDGKVFYTSEDNYIRRFDPATGDQLPALLITSADAPYAPTPGKAYGFRILPDGLGHADGGAGFIIAMSTGVRRLAATGRGLKPAGDVEVEYAPPGGWSVGRPFSLDLAPDAQSFWVATTQEDSSAPTSAGGKVYRFHIATRRLLNAFNPATSGDADVQGVCVRLEYVAGVNQCNVTGADGRGVLVNGAPQATVCRRAAVCGPITGLDERGEPNPDCYAPGESVLTLQPRSNFEGDAVDLDLRPLTAGYRIKSVRGLPPGLAPLVTAGGVVTGIRGTVSYNTCDKAAEDLERLDDPSAPCGAPFMVDVQAWEGAQTSFPWSVYFRNAPPTIAPHANVNARPLEPLTVATPAFDADVDDALLFRARARVWDAAARAWIPGISIDDYGLALTMSRAWPSAAGALAVGGRPTGYPRTAPSYPTVFEITIDVFDCNAAKSASFTPATDLDAACFHHAATTFTVTVAAPNRAPVCTAASAAPALIWPPNHKFVPFRIQGVTDPDGDPIAIRIARITQDQPVDGTGDGRTAFDAIGVGTATASVRAERTGNLRVPEDGRLYQADFTATDGKGGSCTGSVFLGVPHDQGQHSLPRDNGCRWDSTTGAPLAACAWSADWKR